jgi:hypothetical protein
VISKWNVCKFPNVLFILEFTNRLQCIHNVKLMQIKSIEDTHTRLSSEIAMTRCVTIFLIFMHLLILNSINRILHMFYDHRNACLHRLLSVLMVFQFAQINFTFFLHFPFLSLFEVVVDVEVRMCFKNIYFLKSDDCLAGLYRRSKLVKLWN